jgi:nitrile hydratase
VSSSSHTAPPSDPALRVKAIESILVEKGIVDPAAMDEVIDIYEHRIGPHNGAKVVARAWIDPEYKARLLANGSTAIAELGFSGTQGEDMVVLENTPAIHNVVVCTLCSCYPWPVLGLPPVWYKSAPYRSRTVLEPRAVLADSASRSPLRSRSACGIRPPSCAIWSYQCVRLVRTALTRPHLRT